LISWLRGLYCSRYPLPNPVLPPPPDLWLAVEPQKRGFAIELVASMTTILPARSLSLENLRMVGTVRRNPDCAPWLNHVRQYWLSCGQELHKFNSCRRGSPRRCPHPAGFRRSDSSQTERTQHTRHAKLSKRVVNGTWSTLDREGVELSKLHYVKYTFCHSSLKSQQKYFG